jgi:hypothetical protein
MFSIFNVYLAYNILNMKFFMFSVLSDKHRRTIYDMYGEKGLETEGLEVHIDLIFVIK